jgi:uncharacterized iron-regulated membrane protein
MNATRLFRKVHKWGAVITALPVLVIIATGILLQFKKDAAWIQPPAVEGRGGDPSVSFDRILEAARGVPEAQVGGWQDIDRLDVRPSKGMVKVRAGNGWEVQVDTATGAMLHSARRRSDLIEDIHDGSFFAGFSKHWIFLPVGVILLALWGTGLYIFFAPMISRLFGVQKNRKTQQ